MHVRSLGAACLFLAAIPRTSLAGEPGSAVLPVPVQAPPPLAWPPEALAAGLEATVRLRLVIDDEGRVRDVAVLEPAGHGFDELAAIGARQMRFEPGRDAEGHAVMSEVEYVWPFRLDAVPPLSIEGEVFERGSRNRLGGLVVEASGPGAGGYPTVRTVTDAKGTFRFAGLEPGVWTLDLPEGRYRAEPIEVRFEGEPVGAVLHAEARLGGVWETQGIQEHIQVRAQRRAQAPVERVIAADEVAFLPGSLGDPVRAVQNLPGLARAPFGSGELLVRGTDAGDTAYLLDGMRVPVAFHFSALSTVINPEMLDEIAFAPGNWSARYGRAIGGVLDLGTPETLPHHPSTTVGADIFQARAFTSRPLGRKSALFASVRRSYLDAVLNPVLERLDAGAVRAPIFYDAQLRLLHHAGRAGRISGTFLLSDDRFRILGADRSRAAELLAYRTSFQKVQLRWTQGLSRGWSVETSLMAGPETRRIRFDDPDEGADALGITDALFSNLSRGGRAVERSLVGSLRHEWRRDPGSRGIGLTAGVDAQVGRHDLDYDLGDEIEADALVGSPAVYVEPRLRWGAVTVAPGARFEALFVPDTDLRTAFDPRASMRLDLGRTAVTAGFGSFSQPPELRELLSEEGPDLGFERALHTSVGVEHEPFRDLSLGLTLYHHRLHALVVGRDEAFRFDDTQLMVGGDDGPFANDGRGRSTGAELLVRYAHPRWTAWLAATLSRNRRIDRPGEEPLPSATDQPLVLTAIVSHLAPAGVRAGARVRWASGPPMTDVIGRVLIVDNSVWLPVYGPERDARLPSFFAVDVRIDREWTFRTWRLTTYLEVQNATNRRNVEIPSWSDDYARFEPISSLPVLPALGVEASW